MCSFPNSTKFPFDLCVCKLPFVINDMVLSLSPADNLAASVKGEVYHFLGKFCKKRFFLFFVLHL